MEKKVKQTRIILWSAAFLTLVFLLWQGIVPTGQISYSTDFQTSTDFLSKFSPETRVLDNNKIIGNPIYFTLRTPRKFETAKLEIVYKNHTFPLIEAGLLVDGSLWRYQKQPIENQILDQLVKDWPFSHKTDSGLLFLQREKKYDSLEQFLNNLPDQEKIAVYNYNLDQDYIIPDYKATNTTQTINTDLRGDYQFYTYVKEEKLNFDFVFQDINYNNDPDPVDIHLYFKDTLIDSKHLADDRVTSATKKATEPRPVSLETFNLPEGVYKVEVRVNNDILTKEIKTTQQKLAFNNQLRLAFTNENEQKLYTTGQELNAKITDPDRLQSLEIQSSSGTSSLVVDETYKRFSTSLDACYPCQLNLVFGGVDLFSNGVFSFSPDSLLDPSVTKVDSNFKAVAEKIEYVLAQYSRPQKEDGWQKAIVEFDLNQGYSEANKYSFMLSVPGLRAEEKGSDYLEIKEVTMTLTGKNLWQKIFTKD